MYANAYLIGNADLLNDEVRKVGKNGHRLELSEKIVLLEAFVRFFSISYFASASLREFQLMGQYNKMVHWPDKQPETAELK